MIKKYKAINDKNKSAMKGPVTSATGNKYNNIEGYLSAELGVFKNFILIKFISTY